MHEQTSCRASDSKMATSKPTQNEHDHELDGEEENVQPDKKEKKKKQDSEAAADLEKVTDYAEEKEISTESIQNAMSLVNQKTSEERSKKASRERELAKVVIRKEDVELIMTELEVTKLVAERTLREHQGDVVKALISLTN